MYKLLIVDDENQIREGLKKILNWEEYGIEICGEAFNGKQALAMIENILPQIVLTDIKMPEMDGISLLKELKAKGLATKVIVLSGYDDFSLVRQAMKYGAVDYLLKPTGKEELIQIIEELLDVLEDFENREESREGGDIARNHFLNRLITGSINAMEYREKSELLEINFKKGWLAVAKLKKRGIQSGEKDLQQENITILRRCQKYFEEKKIGMPFMNTGDDIVIILKDIAENKKVNIYKEQLEELLNILEKEFSVSLFLAVSKVVKSYRNLATAYEEADSALKYIFIFDERRILYAEEIKEYFRANEVQAVISQEKIEELIEMGKTKEMKEYLESIFGNRQCILKGADIYVFRNMAMEVLVYFYHFLMVRMSSDRIRINKEKVIALQKLVEIETLENMKKYLAEVFAEISQQYAKYTMLPYSKIVSEALRQIKEKYADTNLSLQYLSEELNTNTAYLGRLFKKEVGNSFVDYLNWYRIEKAEVLLKETNLKGSELCEKVGFSNYNYFYVVYKKLKGKKPTEVRSTLPT